MKILLIQNQYLPEIGGTPIYCSSLISFLRKRGHKVNLLTRKYPGAEREKAIFRWLTMPDNETLPVSILDKLNDVVRAWYNHIVTVVLLYKLHPDIVYAHNLEIVGIWPLLAVNKLKIPLVLHLHNPFYANYKKNIPTLKRATSWFLPCRGRELKFNCAIAISRYIQKLHIENGFPEEKTVLIHNGIERNYLQEIPDTRSIDPECRLLFSGFVSSHKGIEDAIAAIGLIKKKIPKAHLDIAGKMKDSFFQNKLKPLIEPNLSANVTFLGEMQPEELQKKRYDQYFCSIVTSVWQEPFGLVVLESMAAGLPVVATAVGGIVDIIENNITGKLVEPHCPHEIAAAIIDLWENKDRYYSIRRNAFEQVKLKFVFEKKAEDVERVIISQ